MQMEFKELDQKALDALVARIEDAIEHDLALSSEDLQLLLSAIQTLAMLQDKIEDQDITLSKLRKLLGMVASSEKKKSLAGSSKRHKPLKKKRSSSEKKADFPVVTHKMQRYKKGDECPECAKGRLYKYAPLIFICKTLHLT